MELTQRVDKLAGDLEASNRRIDSLFESRAAEQREVAAIKAEFADFKSELHEIKTALQGRQGYGEKGLVARVDELIATVGDFKRIYWMVSGAITAGGVTLTVALQKILGL